MIGVVQAAEGIWEEKRVTLLRGLEKMVLERRQRGELKTFQAKERMYEGKTLIKGRTAMQGCTGCTPHSSRSVFGGEGDIHTVVYVQYGDPVRGQGKFRE